ncbi:BsuPI-related putative proteinase inhibitor [Ectobacillus antri]|jgi:hypothetical protein|uniref:DUF5067 domain-containing protein n=1 Tax=Ectobacillus antri TaxID=2486280 RepID=A0ABT6H638_9BACI|nr:BsuPI-related putative proteinase inhibitor [Ectobacillus antri]MDG4657795.1 BsuPI-related putative proteinase inhibitor [Ectobacillus antri]MDG5754814.1 BsuPI-related putative proteinase inhibitor [Ectobacillus antri]
MKKITWFLLMSFLIVIGIIVIFSNKEENKTTRLTSELIYTGIKDNKDIYQFTVKNFEKEQRTIKFLSELELNTVIRGESVPEVTGERILEFYRENAEKEKTISLQAGESLIYHLTVNRELLKKGEYEIRVSLAVDNVNVPMQKYTNTIE